MKIKILIVEDEMIIAEDMRDMLESLGYEVVGVTAEPDEAKRILSATDPDIAMLDITLGTQQLGLNLAEEIQEKFNIPFIFCTSHADPDTISKATKLHPHGYLVKPFDQNDLYIAIEIAIANFSRSKKAEKVEEKVEKEDFVVKDALFIKEGNLYVKVRIDQILYLTPDGNYTYIFESENKKHLVRMPLKDLYELLPGNKFYRTHRSYVVNLEHISAINNQHVYIENTEIPIGKNFREDLLSMIKKMQ